MYTLDGIREMSEYLEATFDAGYGILDIPMLVQVIEQGSWRENHIPFSVLENLDPDGFVLIANKGAKNANVVRCDLIVPNGTVPFELGVDGWDDLRTYNRSLLDDIQRGITASRNLSF